MFSFLKKKSLGTTTTLSLSGLHCASCAGSIDADLEDLPGVISTTTSYAKQQAVIIYDPSLTTPAKFAQVIEKLGYKVVQSN